LDCQFNQLPQIYHTTQGVVDNQAQADEGIYNADPRTALTATPTSFRQWCEDTLKPAVLAMSQG
jgi:hypothetical protein